MKLTDELHRSSLLDLIDAYCNARAFSMNAGKLGTTRIPGKGKDRFLQLFNVYWNLFLPDTEDIEVVVNTLQE